MNGTQQQAAGTRYGQLSKQLEDTQLVVQALAQEIVHARQAFDQAVTNLTAAVDQLQQLTEADLADERRKRQHEIDALENALANERRLRDAYRASLWTRLRWLLLGHA
jgi:hypothetical protein